MEEDKSRIEGKLRELVEFEVKRKMLVKLFDKLMEGAKQLSDEEIVEFSRKFKKAGSEELEKKGLI
ncbi:MAG: hypothetical protein JTT15_00090 [Candidatus Brockarchaeota archaeon]|nr:hypothetical protein [Candidatus Brockarchaeota archaeon]MBO3840585.1 hypothetical protein [Candidatus Brockarchaeota archaeon]